MLKIQKKESIHSYVFRTHMVNGVSSFSNIITSKGLWAASPKILKGSLHLYKPVDDLKFLNLLRDFGLAHKTNDIFGNPASYRDELERFFGINKRKIGARQRTFPITYCLECIKNYIQNFGYGIISIDWYQNSYCSIHNMKLHIAKANNREQAVAALNFILKGEHPEDYESLNYKAGYILAPQKDSQKHINDYFLPCLVNDFKNWVTQNFKLFSKELLGAQYGSVSFVTKPYMMKKIYYSAKENKHQGFTDFFNKSSKVKHLDSGAINRGAITEKAYKSQTSKCHDCEYTSCFANLAIIPTRADVRLTRRCELNLLILIDYLAGMGISNYSKRLRIIRKMSTNQKMKALSDFNGPESDFYRRHSIALDHSKFTYAEPYLMWPED
ncbi:hypothetical protein [Idiomarina sp.]|uniref:hypothetical protein n=1 Tax=Idiomarina sp. TaxID=1874361 RepID=UPI003A8ED805